MRVYATAASAAADGSAAELHASDSTIPQGWGWVPAARTVPIPVSAVLSRCAR